MTTDSETSTAADTSRQAPMERVRRNGISATHREWIAAYLFLAPDVLGLMVFVSAM